MLRLSIPIATILALVLCCAPVLAKSGYRSTVATQHDADAECDVAEVNYKLHRDGRLQFVPWDVDRSEGRLLCQGFMMISDWRVEGSHLGGVVVCRRHGEGVVRLRFSRLRVTRTKHDPERDNLRLFPSKYRRDVWKEVK